MLTQEEFADIERLAAGHYADTIEYINAEAAHRKEAAMVMEWLAQELRAARKQIEIKTCAMEIVAHFIKDHDLFASAAATITQFRAPQSADVHGSKP